MLTATTKGLGPFNPAIRLNGQLWVLKGTSFPGEDTAGTHAQLMVDTINDRVVDMLRMGGFMPTADVVR